MTAIATETEQLAAPPSENGKATAMDDEMATRKTVPNISRRAPAKERGTGRVALIQRTIIRHRFEEAAMLAELTARVLDDVAAIAGAENGTATTAETRSREAAQLAQTISNSADQLGRTKGVEVQVVKGAPEVEP